MESDELDLGGMSLNNEDIVPIQYMTDLTELDLRNNQISDLTPLAGLVNLTSLGLDNNKISNLTPLTISGKRNWSS